MTTNPTRHLGFVTFLFVILFRSVYTAAFSQPQVGLYNADPSTFQTLLSSLQSNTAPKTVILSAGSYPGWGKVHLTNTTIIGHGAILTGPCSLNGSTNLTLVGLTFDGQTLALFSDDAAPLGTISLLTCTFRNAPLGLSVESTGGPPAHRILITSCSFTNLRTAILLGAASASVSYSTFDRCGSSTRDHAIYGVHGTGPISVTDSAFVLCTGENALDLRGGGRVERNVFDSCSAAVSGLGPGVIADNIIIRGGSYPSGAGAHAIEWKGNPLPSPSTLFVVRNTIAHASASATGIAIDGPFTTLSIVDNVLVSPSVSEGRALWLQSGISASTLTILSNTFEVPLGNVCIVPVLLLPSSRFLCTGNAFWGTTFETPIGRRPLSEIRDVFSGSIITPHPPFSILPDDFPLPSRHRDYFVWARSIVLPD